MRPVNLLPPEDRRGDHAPLRAGAAAYAIVGVLAAALIGLVLVVLTGNDITESKAELARLETREQAALARAADLAPYGQFATLEQTRNETVTSLAESRFDWERVLNELALVIPERVTLESLTGTATSGVSLEGASATAADSSITGPSVQISGCAPGQRGTARLLAALRDIDGVTRVGMQSSELAEETEDAGGQPAIGEDAGATTTCATEPDVAQFAITIAFDAVPIPEAAPVAGSTATPAATTPAPAATTPATTTPAATTTTPATTTEDTSGVTETRDEQQSATDSAAEQTGEAADAANVGGN